jgi:hypothetical protein
VSRGFAKGRGAAKGTVVVRFDGEEAEVLRVLLAGQLELLDVGDPLGDDADPLAVALGIGSMWTGEPVEPPEDPALARLFPDAYRGDAGESGEFRRLTEADLREGKRLNARMALETLEKAEEGQPLTLDADGARAWLGALNDVRLVLGTRLDITDDDDDPLARIGPDDPRFFSVHLYYWLGFLQETLVEVLPLG